LLWFGAPRTPGATLFPYTTLFRSMVAVRTTIASRITGFGPTEESSLPPAQEAKVAAIAATMPKTPLWITVQPITFEAKAPPSARSEEHTSELQSRENLVCRLLLEK